MMMKNDLPSGRGIVHHSIKEDVLCFGFPALSIFLMGLITCSWSGYDGMFKYIWRLVISPELRSQMTLHNYLGVALVVVGFSIAVAAVFTLKDNYASTLVIRKDHVLIRNGLYRFVRHPIYLGVLMVCIGVPVNYLSPSGMLVMSLLFPIFLFRIRREETILIQAFGDDYRQYARSTKRLIPFVF